MRRREFIKSAAAALAFSDPAYAEQLADRASASASSVRAGHGKADLLRMIQVAPVDVVSLCDVDRRIGRRGRSRRHAAGVENGLGPMATTARCCGRAISTSS